jgi:hypothetical protein
MVSMTTRDVALRCARWMLLVVAVSTGGSGCRCRDSSIIRSEPPGPREAPVLALGASHSCVLEDGKVTCWGNWRALPIGKDTRGRPRAPTLVPGLPRVTDLKANGNRTCALRKDQRVTCWGQTLGDKPEAIRPPTEVPGTKDAVALLSADPLCIRHRDRRISCQDTKNRLEFPQEATPAIASSYAWCLLDGAGAVRCGSIGKNEVEQVVLPGKAKSVSTSMEASCALLEDGRVLCWGSRAADGLEGRPEASVDHPALVPLPYPAKAVVAGSERRCALLSTGEVSCWGSTLVVERVGEYHPQAPTVIASVDHVEAIGLGGSHLCLATPRGVRCGGNNDQGQLGQGRRSAATATLVEVRRGQPVELRAFEKLPDCASAAGCRPKCGACPPESLCAADGTCRAVRRVEKKRKQKNGVVSWEALQWGDPVHERMLSAAMAEVVRDLSEEGSDAEECQVNCSVRYLSDAAVNLLCTQYVYYAGGAHGMTSVRSIPLDLTGPQPRPIDYDEVATSFSCEQNLEEFAIDSLLDQNAMWIVDGSVTKADHDFALSRVGLLFGYGLYSVQPYMGGMASVEVPCTVLRAVGCSSPWIDDMCR